MSAIATRITVRVQPGSKRDAVDMSRETIRVRVAAPAADGKANARLVLFLAGLLGLPRSSIEIEHGASSRTKLLLVTGLERTEIDRRLAAAGRAG